MSAPTRLSAEQSGLGFGQARIELLKLALRTKADRGGFRCQDGLGKIRGLDEMHPAGQARIAFDGVRHAVSVENEVESEKAAVVRGGAEIQDPALDAGLVLDPIECHGDRAGSDRRAVDDGRQDAAVIRD